MSQQEAGAYSSACVPIFQRTWPGPPCLYFATLSLFLSRRWSLIFWLRNSSGLGDWEGVCAQITSCSRHLWWLSHKSHWPWERTSNSPGFASWSIRESTQEVSVTPFSWGQTPCMPSFSESLGARDWQICPDTSSTRQWPGIQPRVVCTSLWALCELTYQHRHSILKMLFIFIWEATEMPRKEVSLASEGCQDLGCDLLSPQYPHLQKIIRECGKPLIDWMDRGDESKGCSVELACGNLESDPQYCMRPWIVPGAIPKYWTQKSSQIPLDVNPKHCLIQDLTYSRYS